jgi:hypothetical protein
LRGNPFEREHTASLPEFIRHLDAGMDDRRVGCFELLVKIREYSSLKDNK